MSDLITTQLGTLTAAGQGYPAKSKGAGAHTVVASVSGVGAVSFAGSLMGSNDNLAWVLVAALGNSGTGIAAVSQQIAGDYGFWRFDVTDLAAGATAVAVLSTDSTAEAVGVAVSRAARNVKVENTKVLRQIIAGSGLDGGELIAIGDSFPQARGAAVLGDAGARKFAGLTQLAAALRAAGHTVYDSSVCGWGNCLPATIEGYIAYDPRVSYTGAVVSQPGVAGLGYQMFQLGSGATITFTPGETFDTLDVFWYAQAGKGSFTVSDAGGVKATINSASNPLAVRSQTVTLAAGTTAVTFTATSADAVISFWRTRTAAVPGLNIMNAGIAGMALAQFAPSAVASPSGTQGSLSAIKALAPNNKVVIFLNGWYNDYKAGRTLAQFSADLRAFCAFAKNSLGAEVWYFNYADLDPIQVSAEVAALWSGTAMTISIDEYNLPVIDGSRLIPNNAAALADGIFASDKLHLRKPGHRMVWVDAVLNAMHTLR